MPTSSRKFYILHLARMGGYYPPVSFRVSEATRNLITTKPEFCHSEHRRCEESLLLYKHKLFFTLRWRYFWRKSNQKRQEAWRPSGFA